MKFTLKRPCNDCPFRREGGVRLYRARIREIVAGVTGNPGSSFPCHKTVQYDVEEDDEQGELDAATRDASHCAGALIFAHKQEAYPQLIRIMGRLGMYDPERLEEQDTIFDSLHEMLASALDASRAKRRR